MFSTGISTPEGNNLKPVQRFAQAMVAIGCLAMVAEDCKRYRKFLLAENLITKRTVLYINSGRKQEWE